MLEKAGLEVVAETMTGALVRPFMFLDRHVPAVRRHGYLLATVVEKRFDTEIIKQV
jgi:hypothetical protein